jgi:hypothetical protein
MQLKRDNRVKILFRRRIDIEKKIGARRVRASWGGTMIANEPIVSHRKIRPPSNRAFGLVFAAVFAFIGIWPVIGGQLPRLWALCLAGGFLLTVLAFPAALTMPNRLWQRVGLALHRVTTPLAMALIYYTAVLPSGLMLKALRRDLLRLERDPAAVSYWIQRDPPGPERGSMTRQF